MNTVYYLTSGDVLKGRVEPIIWMRTAEWLSRSGFNVKLISTYFYRRENISVKDIFQHYGIEKRFKIVILPTAISKLFSNINWMRLNYLFVFIIYLVPIFLTRRKSIYFSKTQICMQVVIFLEKIIRLKQIKVFELHAIDINNKRLFKMLKKIDMIIVNSRVVMKELKAKGIEKDKILTVYNAQFAYKGKIMSKEKACAVTGISSEKHIVMHIGKVLDDTIAFFIQVAKKIRNNKKFEFHIVGGNPDILKYAKKAIKNNGVYNIIFHGFVPPSRIYIYMSSADMLVCYYPDTFPMMAQATPAKCTDYLWSERPFLCSNNTAMGEILKDFINCIFYCPHDYEEFVGKINYLVEQQNVCQRIVSNNIRLSKTLSWKNRVSKIAQGITRISKETSV